MEPAATRDEGDEEDGEVEPTVVETVADRLDGVEQLSGFAEVSQAPIGRQLSSNPVTYIGVWDRIRKLFASQPEAIERGLSAGHFSFNSKGACSRCGGSGRETISLGGNLKTSTRCKECDGKRYNDEARAVRYRGKTIVDVLDLRVSEAVAFFEGHQGILSMLQVLERIGMGYIGLGQPTPSLSGGESQRIKLAKEIGRRRKGNILYVMDEPTTGLSLYDTAKLIDLLDGLVAGGSSAIVIEHDPIVLSSCDWIIELGPEGGAGGGRIVAEGTPESLRNNPASLTGRYLPAEQLAFVSVAAKRDYWPTTSWRTAAPEAVGMRSEKLGELDALLRSRHRNVRGLVVVRKGYVVFEWYGAGCGPEDTHNVASVTKSVVSALVGIAIEAGFIRSVDQKVLEFFPEYVPGAGDLQKRTLTLRHLLTMTAPVAWKTGAWGYEPLNRLRRQRDWVQFSLDLLGRSGERGRFQYSSVCAHLISAILTRATGRCAREFANERLFRPLGMKRDPGSRDDVVPGG